MEGEDEELEMDENVGKGDEETYEDGEDDGNELEEEVGQETGQPEEGNDSEDERNYLAMADYTAEENKVIMKLSKELFVGRLKLTCLKRKRRLLLEELHRHCLEGEIDPKKRMKVPLEKLKRAKTPATVSALNDD